MTSLLAAPSTGRVLALPAEAAWRVLTAVDSWPAWGPTVRAARLDPRWDGDGRIGPGATGRVQTPFGLWLAFRVTTFDETPTHRSWSWSVAGVAATTHVVEPVGDLRCRVTFVVPRWAPVYLPVCAVALRRIEAAAA